MPRTFVITFVSCLVLGSLGCDSIATDDENRATGNLIVAALEKFRGEHGTFPESLDELVPDFLGSERDICWRSRQGREKVKRYQYEMVDAGEDFLLLYPQAPIGFFRSDAAYQYRSSRGEWRHIIY
jgi:hypothetical protein